MARLRKVPVVMRITERAIRCWPLGEWALLRRVLPDGSSTEPDAGRFLLDKGSSLSFDDLGFMAEIGNHVVSSTARFPVMSAAENLVGAAQVHSATFKEGRIATASVATLCRSAIESSAKTIWLLGDPSREIRRAKCLGFIERERSYQQPFIDIEEEIFAIRTDGAKATDYQDFQRHRAAYDKRQNVITSLPEDARHKPPRKFERVVAWAAEWIDANPPPHAATELGLGMTLGAKSFYAFGSSFVHGYKWVSDYVRDDAELLKMIADGFAAAVIMTECAVALFEAQSTLKEFRVGVSGCPVRVYPRSTGPLG